MNEIYAGNHLPRAWRYQFQPSTFDPSINSQDGVTQTGYGAVTATILSDPINSFTISPTASGTLTCPYDIGMKTDWLFTMYPGFSPTDNAMYCRATNVYVDPSTGVTEITFLAYQSIGEGTFDAWYVESDIRASLNFVQNPQYSAVDAKDRTYVSTANFTWPTSGTSNLTVTSDTDLNKSGYWTSSYKGICTVVEDEYDYNRPYEGITITSTRNVTKTVTTTVYTYDPPDSSTTVVVSASSPITHTFIITAEHFDPLSPNYFEGNTNADPGGPTPSYQTNEIDLGNRTTSEYDETYEAWYPYPGAPAEYRIIQNVVTNYELEGDEGTIDPGTFFPVSG